MGMVSIKSHARLRLLSALFMFCFVSVPAFAQDDPDPNSPTPVLLRAKNSKRVLAVMADTSARVDPSSAVREAFPPGSRIAFFVSGIRLMEGEGANSFRVHAEDSRGRKYRFPVV